MQIKREVLFSVIFGVILALSLWTTQTKVAAQEEPPGGTNPPPNETLPPPAPIYLPIIYGLESPPPEAPDHEYDAIQVDGGSIGWPAAESPDVNLSLRGFVPASAYLGLVNYGGDTDPNAPQLADLFVPPRLPGFLAAYRVNDWDWNCNPPPGCPSGPLSKWDTTLMELATTPGEIINIPSRQPDIFVGIYRAMVLYAEEYRLTLVYTRQDSPALGYVIHLEDLVVSPDLLALYERLDREGRSKLPALRNGELVGVAAGASIKVSVRDTGEFMDPRACKDWWMDYRDQCVVQLKKPQESVP